MTARMRAVLRFLVPALAVLFVAALGAWLYTYCTTAPAKGVTAGTMAVFLAFPGVFIWEAWRRERRVLCRGTEHEVLRHESLKSTETMRLFAASVWSLARIAEMRLRILPEIDFKRHINNIYYTLELDPFAALQDPHRPTTKIGGYELGTKLAVEWCPNDLERTNALVLHEVGHLLLTTNYPRMTVEKQHQVLQEARL